MSVRPGWLPHVGRLHGVTPPAPSQQLPFWTTAPPARRGLEQPRWWWLGVAGGVGTSSLAEASRGAGGDAGHAWPDPAFGPPYGVVLVARSTVRGLDAASLAARQHAAGCVPAGTQLLGLVVVADAPGKLPRRLTDHLEVIGGAVPNLWRFGWCEPWRHRPPTEQLDEPPDLRRLLAAIDRVIEVTGSPFAQVPPSPRRELAPEHD